MRHYLGYPTRQFLITGAPATKKTSQRIVRRKKDGKQFIIPSQRTTDWTKSAVAQLRQQHQGGPLTGDVCVEYFIHRAANRGDLSNYISAIDHALQEAGVLENDKQITHMIASKLLDRGQPRVVIVITSLEEEHDV